MRHAARLFAVLLLAGCRAPRAATPVTVVDFIKQFDRAEKRPTAGFSISEYSAAGSGHAAIVAVVPNRLTWVLPIPRHGVFRAIVAADTARVRIRVGVSDDRIFEELAAATVVPGAGWSTLSASLSAYAGWKFSLFYRPEERAWRLNLSADAIDGVPARLALGMPEITAGTADALEYEQRRLRLAHRERP